MIFIISIEFCLLYHEKTSNINDNDENNTDYNNNDNNDNNNNNNMIL